MTDNAAAQQEALLSALRLTMVPGVGPRTQRNLLDRFGSAEAVLKASAGDLNTVSGVGPKLIRSITEARLNDRAETEMREAAEHRIDLIPQGHAEYPRPLMELPDSPLVMYRRGGTYERDELAVAIVGSRNCTLYGRQQAEKIGGALARAGITIVSGLARGIDAAAHQGAIKAGGRTIAVLGSGLLNIYPPEHQELARDVAGSGAVISEFSLHQRPSRGLFPQRNRIISGLSLAVLLIEARSRSGALHTARHAMEQGRDVLALPGKVDNPASGGCHELIRDGATLVRHADDVLDGLGPLSAPVKTTATEEVHNPRELTLNEREREILNLVSSEETPIEQVLSSTDLAPAVVLSTLTILEMKKLVRRLPGNHITRRSH